MYKRLDNGYFQWPRNGAEMNNIDEYNKLIVCTGRDEIKIENSIEAVSNAIASTALTVTSQYIPQTTGF